MIAKRIHHDPKNDDYKNLGNYIRDAHHSHVRLSKYIIEQLHVGEKVLFAWHSGCLADDYGLALQEVDATQSLNTRTTKEKTYHLMISFRPEDEESLTEKIFRDIEREFAKSLGFDEHQCHCGVHKNTNYIHMHISYNMIHPEKLTRHEPFRDYYRLAQTCRAMEKKYGLAVDRGMEKKNATPTRINQKSQAMEAHSGQQSFEGYVCEHVEALLTAAQSSADWHEFHRHLATWGVDYGLRNNGAVIKDRHGKHAVKPSAIAREFSKTALEQRFGKFQACRLSLEEVVNLEKEKYTAKPLQRGPERDELYAEYRAGIELRKARLTAAKEEFDKSLDEVREHIEKKHRIIQQASLSAKDRHQLLRELAVIRAKEVAELRQKSAQVRQAVRETVPYWNWNGFLKMKAERGNEMALAILRSREKKVEPEKKQIKAEPEPVGHMRWRLTRKQIQARKDLLWEDKMKLVALSRMEELAASDSRFQGFKWRVDNRGVILISLPSGGVIRDAPQEILFSNFDPLAKEAAEGLAKLKFGKNYVVNGMIFSRQKEKTKER